MEATVSGDEVTLITLGGGTSVTSPDCPFGVQSRDGRGGIDEAGSMAIIGSAGRGVDRFKKTEESFQRTDRDREMTPLSSLNMELPP